MLICDVRHNWPKKANYIVDRPAGRPHYIFAHYDCEVTLICGGHTFQIPPGGCVLIEPDTAHWLHCAQDLTHDWLHLDPEADVMISRYNLPVNTPFFPNNNRAISAMLQKMETEFYSSNPFKEELLELYVKEFLIWLHRANAEASTTFTFSEATVRKMTAARKTILSASEKNWTLQEMAALVSFSPSRFHVIYKTLFGTTPTKDLINMRINLAESLLCAKPDITLSQVAEILGYNDQYHFIRQFKTITGQTPGKYRKGMLK